MVLRPEMLVLSEKEVREADAMETQVDQKLKQEFVPGKSCLISTSDYSERICNEIVRRYKAAGWSEVTFKIEDGIFFWFEQ